jgi:hypothetical protein
LRKLYITRTEVTIVVKYAQNLSLSSPRSSLKGPGGWMQAADFIT